MATHERVWEQGASRRPPPLQEWKPKGTYALLGTIAVVFVLQMLVLGTGRGDLYRHLFTVNIDWLVRPWSLVTSTLSHGDLPHLFFNGLFLFFFGPSVERLLGTKRFLWLFFVAGALSGILQVHLATAWDLWRMGQPWAAAMLPWTDPAPYRFLVDGGSQCVGACGALGASGSLMMLFGVLMVLTPQATVMLLFPPIPLKMWMMGLGYAVLDILGVFGVGRGGIGNFAHLSGMALGMLFAWRFKKELAGRGMQIQYG